MICDLWYNGARWVFVVYWEGVVVTSLIVGRIYRATWKQEMLGQQVLNVQYYRCEEADVTATMEDAGDAMGGLWLTQLAPYLSNTLLLKETLFEDAINDVNFVLTAETATGADDATSPLPAFMAWHVQQVRTTKTTRHGGKRIAGVTEGNLNSGVPNISNAYIAGLESFAGDNLEATGTQGHDYVLAPVIIGRDRVEEDGKVRYVPDYANYNYIKQAVFKGISTQRTRKPGRGA